MSDSESNSEINEMKDLTVTSSDELNYITSGIEKIKSMRALKKLYEEHQYVVVLTTSIEKPSSNKIAQEYEDIAREQKETSKNLLGTYTLVKFAFGGPDDSDDDPGDDETQFVIVFVRDGGVKKGGEYFEIDDFSKRDVKSVITDNIKKLLNSVSDKPYNPYDIIGYY